MEKKIREIFDEFGFTYEQIAIGCKVSVSTASRIINGKCKPHRRTAIKFVKFFNGKITLKDFGID